MDEIGSFKLPTREPTTQPRGITKNIKTESFYTPLREKAYPEKKGTRLQNGGESS